MIQILFLLIIHCFIGQAATIAIIDTGFDLDHDYLRPKILKKETDEEALEFVGQDLFDNSHLKKPVIDDKSELQEILLYRNLRAKGHRQGLSVEEFEWYKKKKADKTFMDKVKLFKKHTHGTFVAGIALREGENIKIFPIRGLNLPNPVVAVEDTSDHGAEAAKGKNAEEKFQDEIRQSIDRISRKFSKICRFVSLKKIEIVNASYGITYKNIMTKFRERYKEMTGQEIEETKLKMIVDDYFSKLYASGEKTMKKYPHILFVFSAGNSGLDNDEYHHYPSRIKVPNAISVAAMNGEYLATFSNFGKTHVDVGAPGVAILSIVPKVYSDDGSELYSPASGTSMSAPYISNLAAQIKNTNPKLTPEEIKKIILETGEEKEHLKSKIASAAIANNHKAIKAALLSKDMVIDQAITLGKSDLVPMEDKISIGLSPARAPEEMKKKIMEAFPSAIPPQDVEEVQDEESTKPESSLSTDQETKQPDNLSQRLLSAPEVPAESADPVPASQNEAQSPQSSEETPASSSEPQPSLPEVLPQVSGPSSPQL